MDTDLKENFESCCWAVWLAESGRSSVEMFCMDSGTPSSPQSSNNMCTLVSTCSTICLIVFNMQVFTSCPIVSPTRSPIAWTGPLNIPVLVQDVFSCLHLAALCE